MEQGAIEKFMNVSSREYIQREVIQKSIEMKDMITEYQIKFH